MGAMDPTGKYEVFPPLALKDRTWPDTIITKAPVWCSVDLRDGNQALIEPMGPDRKKRFFKVLVGVGFKEIEVGFPSASADDYDFLRMLIEENMIPDDVTIQVLTQSREELIRRSFESLRGCKRAIMHLYNSTSPLQRRVVFGSDRAGTTKLAVEGARLTHALAREYAEYGLETVYQYSPESFSSTEMDYAVEICTAVAEIYQPTPDKKLILNLPATVEHSTPNIHADQIEYFCRHFSNRDTITVSLHPHNDRGSAIAATELALMAGADRVEGTLFGNGERTGNVDLVTLALNLYSQGVDPQLDLSDINALREVAEYCNRLPVHPRHPYAGDLVFTAFSGSHQDAIKKGFVAMEKSNSSLWEVPYLPIDPSDLGRNYEAVIRINSQSGKGGIAYVMEKDHGFELPRGLQIEFSKTVQNITDDTGKEVSSESLREAFFDYFVNRRDRVKFLSHQRELRKGRGDQNRLTIRVEIDGRAQELQAVGNGPIDAYVAALSSALGFSFQVIDYHQHALGRGASAVSATYIEMQCEGIKGTMFGVGVNSDIVIASLHAVSSAVNRLLHSKTKA